MVREEKKRERAGHAPEVRRSFDYSAWGFSTGRPAFRTYTVAEKVGPITTAMGMSVNPRYTFADAPKPDVLVLPGGGVPPHLDNPALMAWVKEASKDAPGTAPPRSSRSHPASSS